MAARDELTHRLFFAFDLDDNCRDAVDRLINELAERLDPGKSASKGRIKWVERENLHLTVSFLGATPDSKLEAIRRAVQSPLASDEFELQFTELGAFPERGTPRVIWLADASGAPDAQAAQRELSGRLQNIGIPTEKRPFRAHLTLGRFRQLGHRDDLRVLRDVAFVPIGPLLVDHVTLYKSHLSNRGPRYEELLRARLRKEELGGRRS